MELLFHCLISLSYFTVLFHFLLFHFSLLFFSYSLIYPCARSLLTALATSQIRGLAAAPAIGQGKAHHEYSNPLHLWIDARPASLDRCSPYVTQKTARAWTSSV